MPELTIPARFCGPPRSANGGYTAGLLAREQEGVTTVRLHAPPPLDTPLELRTDGETTTLSDGDTKLASAWPGAFEGEVPAPPGLSEARAAAEGYRGFEAHSFSTCFVCGPDREEGDGLRIFAGPLPGAGLVADVWRPPGPDPVPVELIWAALDCPSFFALEVPFTRPFLLGQMTAQISGPIAPGAEYAVYAWPRGGAGRKQQAGSALADASGRVLARAEHVWFDLAGR